MARANGNGRGAFVAGTAHLVGNGKQRASGSSADSGLLTTLVAIIVVTSLVFLRQRLVDDDRLRLLGQSKEALVNLQRVQAQYVQAEKLASLGQLAAGAAHEINNPLTAILGYSDVLAGDPSVGDRAKEIAEKIREQARRTKGVVGKLLSFAQPQPAEVTLLDVNAIVGNVVELCRADMKKKSIRIELDAESHLPGVRGDANQILQVFFNIINNSVEAMEEVGGGTLSLKTFRHQNNVVIQFSDTGPGIRDPQLAFDPFYTTKAVGKGTGLGLSICYGLVKEHKGQITCANRPEGGATFRIELPAVLALFPGAQRGQRTRRRCIFPLVLEKSLPNISAIQYTFAEFPRNFWRGRCVIDGILLVGGSMPEAAIVAEGLSRSFGNLVAVDHVDLRVDAGQFFGFLGPNGAGKSTTIRMMTGLLAPTAGTINLLGLSLEGDSVEVKRQIGVVPEGLALFDRLTANEYLNFVGQNVRAGLRDRRATDHRTAGIYGLGGPQQDADC